MYRVLSLAAVAYIYPINPTCGRKIKNANNTINNLTSTGSPIQTSPSGLRALFRKCCKKSIRVDNAQQVAIRPSYVPKENSQHFFVLSGETSGNRELVQSIYNRLSYRLSFQYKTYLTPVLEPSFLVEMDAGSTEVAVSAARNVGAILILKTHSNDLSSIRRLVMGVIGSAANAFERLTKGNYLTDVIVYVDEYDSKTYFKWKADVSKEVESKLKCLRNLKVTFANKWSLERTMMQICEANLETQAV